MSQKFVDYVSLSRLCVRDRLPEVIRAPKGRANKAQANGLGLEPDPIVLWEQALQGRNNQALAAAERIVASAASRGSSRPFRAGESRHRIFTQAVGLGFVRTPLWGLGMSSAR